MTQQDLLKRVIDVLDDAGVPYVVVGSFASGIYGDARSTYGVDLMVQLTAV